MFDFGAEGEAYRFDNEGPRHKAWLEPFELARTPVSNGEYQAFIADGGYANLALWLSDGWAKVCAQGWRAPFYWREKDGLWFEHTLHGERPVDPHAPVSHLSYYEAAAYAEWTGYRLPEEREWELAARQADPGGAECAAGPWAEPDGRLHPAAPAESEAQGPLALFGEVWEWTRSAYAPYPGYRAPSGAIGEYNGKFMCGQFVLRGGSILTPPGHVRPTYRNFFPPDARWQMTGLRLARDV